MNALIRRLLVLVALGGALPAFAAEPGQAVAEPAAEAAPAVPAASVAPTVRAAKPAAAIATRPSDAQETAVARVPPGYKSRRLGGETVYCRKSTPLGSRVPTQV
jgi:hypothetical protein